MNAAFKFFSIVVYILFAFGIALLVVLNPDASESFISCVIMYIIALTLVVFGAVFINFKQYIYSEYYAFVELIKCHIRKSDNDIEFINSYSIKEQFNILGDEGFEDFEKYNF